MGNDGGHTACQAPCQLWPSSASLGLSFPSGNEGAIRWVLRPAKGEPFRALPHTETVRLPDPPPIHTEVPGTRRSIRLRLYSVR